MNPLPSSPKVNPFNGLPTVSVLESLGDRLYYHDVKTKKELLALMAFMLSTLASNPSIAESKSAIFKVNGTFYRVVLKPIYQIVADPISYTQDIRYYTPVKLYKANEELIPLLLNWDAAFDFNSKKLYNYVDIWSVVEEDVPQHSFNQPESDDECNDSYVPKYLEPMQCYIWLSVTSPAFAALFASLDKSNAINVTPEVCMLTQ